MSRIISTILRVLALLLPIALPAITGGISVDADTPVEVAPPALSAEDSEFLDWIEDPLADLDLDASMVIWSTSLALGPGYSSNFLKRRSPASSRYLKLEGDFFIHGLMEHSTAMAFLYVEGVQYDADTEVDNEAIVLLHANWTRTAGNWDFGSELDAFAGDQIFDASLSDTASPEGERLRQVRPGLTLFIGKQLGAKAHLELAVNTERALFERSEDDYWCPGLDLEWEHKWLKALETTTTISFFEERYDEDLSLDRRGFMVPSRKLLKIRGYAAEEELSWNPTFLKQLRLTARAGSSYEDDLYGENDDALRYWGSLAGDIDLPWLDLRLTGRWQATRYQNRQVDFFDARRQHQNYRSLRIEAERKLHWNLALRVALEWEDFDSRVSSEQFSERRVETLLSWSY